MKLKKIVMAVMLVTTGSAIAADNPTVMIAGSDLSVDGNRSVSESSAVEKSPPVIKQDSSAGTQQTNRSRVTTEQAKMNATKTNEAGSIQPIVTSMPAESVQVSAKIFTDEQEIRIGEVTKEYLLEHPDFLIQVSRKLEAQQRAEQMNSMMQAVIRYQDVLINDSSTPSYGAADAKVAFIEFFDYQCSVCARQAPIIEGVMKANPQVRYVFKEWPIFAQRWTPSLIAAQTGLQVWKQKGAEAYLAYHNAIYSIDHNEGKLTQADISSAAASAGKLKKKDESMLVVLSRIDELAQNLGLRGTPAMIVMPVNGATVDNVTIIPGGADQKTLKAAIDKASSGIGNIVGEKLK